jgi:putative cardiolipin synthase
LLACAWATVAHAQALVDWIDSNCDDCLVRMASSTGMYILEKGEESLIGRAWLAQHATTSIDVQYFIWSTDNVGILAAEQLLAAAERGVSVRVLVDDTLIDAEDRTLLLLARHPNVQVRIYNPKLSVGVGTWRKIRNVFGDFRAVNQRMHDKTAIFDGVAGVTGGRNMADEYFDFDHDYNFRDRDILLLGQAVEEMSVNFGEFWFSEYSVPVETLLTDELDKVSDEDVRAYQQGLHAYAADPRHFSHEVRQAIEDMSLAIPVLMESMQWGKATFISDIPGKNPGDMGLGGGGESTRLLIESIRAAEESVLIQSPYLIIPEGGFELFEELVAKGVRIRISTNSLASTDNVPAFSGYLGQRERLLETGVEVYEYMARPAIRETLVERHPSLAINDPIFALHAKSLVIDNQVVYIGTFNLDPRSANLNTEVGVLVRNEELARQLTASIEQDIRPENSWQTTWDFNPDGEVSFGKRLRARIESWLPIDPVL